MPALRRTSKSVRFTCALLFLALLAVGPLLDPPAWISAPALAARQTAAGGVGYRGDAARTGNQPGPGPAAAPTERWRFAVHFDQNDPYAKLLADLLVLSWPAVADGVVYAGSLDGALYAIDAASGAQRWRMETGEIGSVAAPVVADGIVSAGAQDGLLFAVEAASGAERWRYDTGGFVIGNPATAEGRVFVATNHALVGLDAVTGQEVWRVEDAEPGLSVPPPAIAGGVVYVFAGEVDAIADTQSGVVIAVEAASGSERWRYDTGFAPSLLGAWDVAVAEGLVVVPGAGFMLEIG
jgi:outer membrane protein assembly factor BamB